MLYHSGRWHTTCSLSQSGNKQRGVMESDELYRRYQELQQYVGWTEEDARRVQSVAASRSILFCPL